MSLAKAFLVFKHVDPCSAQHYRKRELCRLIIKLISSIESRDKNFSKHFKGKWCQEKLWNRFEQLIRGIESNIDNKIYPDNFSDGIKNIRRKPEKFRSSLIIGYETTRSTLLGYVEFHVTRCVKVNLARSGFKKNYCFALDPLSGGRKLISNHVHVIDEKFEI